MADTLINKVTSGTHVNSASGKTNTIYYQASKTTSYVGGTYQAYVVPTMPSRVAGRVVVSAYLEIPMSGGSSGNRTLTVQRNAKPSKSMSQIKNTNKPGVLAGSVASSITQPGNTAVWRIPVKADVDAYMAGAAFYGFRVTSSYGSAWRMGGWASKTPPRLVVEIADKPGIPTGLAPNGIVSVAAPTFTWTAPSGVISARLQVASDAAFTSILFDTGVVATSVAQLDTAALGWAGLADGATAYARVLYSNVAGTSVYSEPITFTRHVLPTLTITGPPSPTPDPSPTVVWSCPGQVRWRVLTYVDGVLTDDSGIQPGADTAYKVTKGAQKTGQQLGHRVMVWDDKARTPSPGDPGYATAIRTVTYTPGTAAPVTDLTVTNPAASDAPFSDPELGGTPWVDISWTRLVGGVLAVADEWMIYRDGVLLDRFDGVDPEGNPVWSYRDWSCPPNRDVDYTVAPVINNAAQTLSAAASIRVRLTGVWVFQPDVDGDYFSLTGGDQSLTFGESSVFYETVGGSVVVKRTFALRGLEGNVGGRVDEFRLGGLTAAEAAIFRIKQEPSAPLRIAFGDVNFPCTADGLSPVIDPESSQWDDIVKTMTIGVRQTGELPFEPLVPATGAL